MEKDEILARAQKENKGKDEFDRELIEKGSVIYSALFIMLLPVWILRIFKVI